MQTQATQQDLVFFRLADQECSLPVGVVREIVHMPHLTRPPGLPSLLEGFLNLSGRIVPVLKLCHLFKLPETEPGLYSPLVVITGKNHPLALLVDQINDVRSVPQKDIVAVQDQNILNNCVQAEILLDGRAVHLLSAQHLLLEQEQQRIHELQAVAQQRLDNLEPL